jgi:arylsulfatase A-like enzyme
MVLDIYSLKVELVYWNQISTSPKERLIKVKYKGETKMRNLIHEQINSVQSKPKTFFNWRRSTAFISALTLAMTSTACSTGTNVNNTVKDKDSNSESSPAVSKKFAQSNIVYIVLDDVGYSDFGSYGSSINTPNIDRLAKSGIQYSNYFTMPLSSPARAAILTGCDANTVGMGLVADVDFGDEVPNIDAQINPEHGTLAQTLELNNYNTISVGKWHLGPYEDFIPNGDKTNWPSGKGFNWNYNFVGSQTNQFEPGSMIEGDKYCVPEETKDYQLANDLTNKSLKYIDDASAKDKEKPFFLYLTPGGMHGPLQAQQKYIDKYKGKYDKGWDIEREQRFNKQKELGLFPQDTVLPARNPEVPAWDTLSKEQKTVAARHMEVYAAYLDYTDEQLGIFIDGLKARNEYDNTIFVVTSDNGATNQGGLNGAPITHGIENLYQTPLDKQYDLISQFGSAKYGTSYNAGWAMASNTPNKLYKFTTFLGGIKVPLIVSGVKGTKEPGRISQDFVSVIDVTPTMLDTIGIPQAKTIDGIKQDEMQGVSFAKTFESKEPVVREKDLFTLLANNMSLITGDGYNMIRTKEGEYELYDLKKDPTQVNNLAAKEPKRLKKMKAEFDKQKDEVYDSQNLVMDLADGVSPIKIILRYGNKGLSTMLALSKGKAPNSKAVEPVKIIQSLQMLNSVAATMYKSPTSKLAKKDYVYDPADGYFSSLAAANTNNISHTIAVPVETTNKDTEGVILANGGLEGGYAFYVKNNKLVYEYNFLGESQKLVSSEALPIGKSEIGFEYQKQGLYEGTGKLKINGKVVAEGKLKTLPIFTSYDYISFGEDVGSRVSADYNDSFKFSGKVGNVKMNLGDDKMLKNDVKK